MTWDEMAVVGRVARPHGLRGEVVINSETDFPERRFSAGAEVFVRRAGSVEPLTVTSVRFQGGRPVVGFEQVGGIEQAEAFAGLELRVPLEELMPLPAGSYYRHDLVGCRVVTQAGEIVGTVTNVEGTADVGRLVVTSGGAEILIPLATAICTAIDAGGKRIVIEPPEGLLDLNR
jgi:16S rRNA processing protein RimM